MFLSALVLLALVGQQPTQQPTAAPKARTMAASSADTSKAKAHRRRAHSKAKPAVAPRDTTKSKP